MNPDNHYDAIILGAGPAGLTAGMYLSRANRGSHGCIHLSERIKSETKTSNNNLA